MKWLSIILIIFFFSSISLSQISIETNFEGGNAQVISINNLTNTLKIRSQLKGGDTKAVVFNFKISGFNLSLPLKIQVQTVDQTFTPYMPAFSYDLQNWFRITGTFVSDYKEYIITNPQQSPIYFADGYPYLYSTLLNHINLITGSHYLTIGNIALSEQNRDVKFLKFTEPTLSDSGKYLIWILARNHAFESHSNWVIDGLIDFINSNDAKAICLRRQAIVYIVPMMDVDMVYNGGTGKDQDPVDFNRDWDSPSYWNAVNGVKQKIIQTSQQNSLKIFLDSHDPFPSDNSDAGRIFVYSFNPSGPRSVNLNTFRNMFYNNGNYNLDRQEMYATSGQTSSRWVDSLFADIEFSTSMETGWINRTDGNQWTIPLYKYNGIIMGKAISDYLSNLIRPDDLIIDNLDSAKVQITGDWYPSTNIGGYWNTNYLHDGNTGKGTKSIKFTPVISQTGDYEVTLRWTSDAQRADNVPVRILHNNGIFDTLISQRNQGGQWVSAGIFNFSSGNAGYVLIKNDNSTGYVIADAVRFSKRVLKTTSIRKISSTVNTKNLISSYPNPFNNTSKIKFQVSKLSDVKIIIYDVLGKELMTLVNGNYQPGEYETIFDGSNLGSGIYFYKIQVVDPTRRTGEYSDVKSMVLIK